MGQDDFKPITLADIEAFECSEVSLGYYCASRCRDGIGGGGGAGGYAGAIEDVGIVCGGPGGPATARWLQREPDRPATPYIQTTSAEPVPKPDLVKASFMGHEFWVERASPPTLAEQATAAGAMLVTKDAAAEVVDLLRIVRAETLSRGIKRRAEAAILALGGTLDDNEGPNT